MEEEEPVIHGWPQVVRRLSDCWSILYSFTLIILLLHFPTACSARIWRTISEDTQEIAEVVHMPYSVRRHLQTGSYCVAADSADSTALQSALDWACGSGTGQGNVNCASLQEGGSCYNPNTIQAHASYAFNSYYVSQNAASNSCYFNGLATVTTTNPSSGSCVYQAYTGTNSSTSSTGTPPPPFTSSSPPSNDNNTGTLFSPPGDNTTTGTANFASPSFHTIPWLHAFCGGILLVAFLPRP